MIAERALISGLMPRFAIVYISMESVETPPPVVKKEITKSSMDIVKARIAPVTIPGEISGMITLKKARSGVAPRSIAASYAFLSS